MATMLDDSVIQEQSHTDFIQKSAIDSEPNIGSGKFFNRLSNKRAYLDVEDKCVKKKCAVKRFRKEWMDEPLFKGWLQPILKNPERCYCTLCDVDLIAGHSELEKHASGKKHCDMLLNQLSTLEESNHLVLINEIKEEVMDSNDSTEATIDASGLVADKNFIYFDNNTMTYKTITPAVSKIPMKIVSDNGGLASIPSKTSPSILRNIRSVKANKAVTTAQLFQSGFKTSHLPENPDAQKLIHCLNSDSEDDESIYDIDDSTQVIKEIKAELAMADKKRLEEQPTEEKPQDFDELQRYLAEREMEAKIRLIEERRKQNFNLYKLKLLEMEAKVRLAEAEFQRSAEIHQLRLQQLGFQIEKEKEVYCAAPSE